jgi:hypothetical protein
MDPRKVAVPLLAFAGGAVLGRLLGLKTLMRGAMAAAAVTGMTRPAYGADGDARRLTGPRRRKRAQRAPARRTAAKRSASS